MAAAKDPALAPLRDRGETTYVDFGPCKNAGEVCARVPLPKMVAGMAIGNLVPGICTASGEAKPETNNAAGVDWEKKIEGGAGGGGEIDINIHVGGG